MSDTSHPAWMFLLEHATSLTASHRTPTFGHLFPMSITRNNWAIEKIAFAFHLPSL
jgi:hypothetical protein